mmetsp:Transcript_121573/g.190751  ORF Transcript_121573/g.190751 Transcript_121573/m.190751 type:complete len:187 (+) Transcript_121573:55-615(+)
MMQLFQVCLSIFLCILQAECSLPVPVGHLSSQEQRKSVALDRRQRPLAMVAPDAAPVVGAAVSLVGIYQTILTIRILLSWIPQAQGVALLQPVFVAADAYLNLFRGVVPPIGGIDISPIGAFFLLDWIRSSTVSLAATMDQMKSLPQVAQGKRLFQSLQEKASKVSSRRQATDSPAFAHSGAWHPY